MLSSPARLFASAAAEVAVFESAATATAAVPAAARATEAPFGLGSRFIHHERASLQLMLVKLADRALCLLVRRHLDKREPARPAGGHVAHHADVVHLTGPAEELRQLLFRRRVRKVPYIQSPAHLCTYSCFARTDPRRLRRGCNRHAVFDEHPEMLAKISRGSEEPTCAAVRRADDMKTARKTYSEQDAEAHSIHAGPRRVRALLCRAGSANPAVPASRPGARARAG